MSNDFSAKNPRENGDHHELSSLDCLQEPLLPPPSSDESPVQNDNNNKDVVVRCCGKKRLQMNHNVFFNLLLAVLYGMSDSLWGGTVFAAYLKKLGHGQNGPVGDIEAVNGLAVLFSALPVGYLADRCGRGKIIRAGGALFIVTAIMHAVVITWIGIPTDSGENLLAALSNNDKSHLSFVLLAIIMAMWGIGGGIVSGPCQALYADSTPAGERSQYYFYLFVGYISSSCLGPIVSIILFQKLGDDWDLFHLRTIIYVGLGMEVVNAVIMMFFDDTKALDEGSEESIEQETTAEAVDNDNTTATTTASGRQDTVNDPESAQQDNHATNLTENLIPSTNDNSMTSKNRKWIPYIMFVASLIMSIGSGMTVKFFPLFFKDEVGMTPTHVQIIYVLVPIVMVLFSGVGTNLSKWLGRVQTTMFLQFAGLSCLYSMVFFQDYLDRHPFILVPIYILRTGLMNSPYPLQESILMDFVPKNERARWKSLESISQFGWCGSAALGGYFSDRWDYTHTFLITAVIQTIGTLCFGLLLPLVPRREQDLARAESL